MAIPPILIEVSPAGNDLLRLTYTCMLCDNPNQIDVSARLYALWRSGTAGHVQDVFPDMSAGEREALISGSHAKCFDEAFKDPQEDLEEEPEGVYEYKSPYETVELPPFVTRDKFYDDDSDEPDDDDDDEEDHPDMYPHDEHVGLDLPEGYGS
jgi:hypothetical protein